MRKLFHYKCGLVGEFETEELGEAFMRDLGGVFKWDSPFEEHENFCYN